MRAACPLLLSAWLAFAGQIAPDLERERSQWMRCPKPAAPEPSDPARLARIEKWDAWMDGTSGDRMPLEELKRLPNRPHYGPAGCPSGFAHPELPISRDVAIVVAHFEDYQPHISHSHWSIYSEVSLRVERILQPGPSPLTTGGVATLVEIGGTIQMPDWQVLQYRALCNRSGLEPGHRYVLLLSYVPDAGFWRVAKSWELCHGIVTPHERVDFERARNKKSTYAGMREEEFVAAIEELVSAGGNQPNSRAPY